MCRVNVYSVKSHTKTLARELTLFRYLTLIFSTNIWLKRTCVSSRVGLNLLPLSLELVELVGTCCEWRIWDPTWMLHIASLCKKNKSKAQNYFKWLTFFWKNGSWLERWFYVSVWQQKVKLFTLYQNNWSCSSSLSLLHTKHLMAATLKISPTFFIHVETFIVAHCRKENVVSWHICFPARCQRCSVLPQTYKL